MKLCYSVVPHNNNSFIPGTRYAEVDSEQIFNFDAVRKLHNNEERDFLNTVSTRWTIVPYSLLDPTTRANFAVYVRIPERIREELKPLTDGETRWEVYPK